MTAAAAEHIEQNTSVGDDAYESGFRSGYWEGMLAACNEIIGGATQHDVRLWLFREVKEWTIKREDGSYSGDLPTPCPHGRSFEESTLHTKSQRPVPGQGKCFVYAVGDGHGHTKIGIANDIQSRIRSLQTGNSSRLYLICYVAVESRQMAERAESWCHNELRDERMCGEWFSVYDDNAWQALFDCVEAIGIKSDVVEVEHRVY